MSASTATKFDLKSKEGAEAAAQEVAKLLGENWVTKVRGSGYDWTFTVKLEKSGRFCEIEVTPAMENKEKFTAWIESLEYRDNATANSAVEAVKRVRLKLSEKIADLQEVAARIGG
jgi:hypothetical protein